MKPPSLPPRDGAFISLGMVIGMLLMLLFSALTGVIA